MVPGPKGPTLYNPPSGFFYPLTATRARRQLGPPIMGFLPIDLPCGLFFILVIPSLNLIVSCPYVLYYLYMHILCVFRSTLLGTFLFKFKFICQV